MSHKIVIVDYGMGNLFSVEHACRVAGLAPVVTSDSSALRDAAAAIIPGVGAFPTAMDRLRQTGMVDALRTFATSGRCLVGVCLGMQLLMSESEEFGMHEGLGLVPGLVKRLPTSTGPSRLKVPHVGWNSVNESVPDIWSESLLAGIKPGVEMYFVHSYFAEPADAASRIAWTSFGDLRFASAIRVKNIHGIQPHPERSGPGGLAFYRNLAAKLSTELGEPSATTSVSS